MKDKIEIKGIWHLPSSHDSKTAGILTYIPNKYIRLELIGALQNSNEVLFFTEPGNKYENVIYGESSDGELITLFNCSRSGSQNLSSSFALLNYNITHIIRGAHLEEYEQEDFDYIEVKISQLTSWLCQQPVAVDRPIVNGKLKNIEIIVNPENDFVKTFDIAKGLKLELYVKGHYNRNLYEIKVETISFASIYSDKKTSIWGLLKEMNVFKSFLSLGCLQPATYDSIEIELQINLNSKIQKRLLKYIYVDHAEIYNLQPDKFLFNYPTIQTNFQQIILKWYDNTKDMFPIRRHLIDTILHKPTFSSNDFLVLAFAVEGYYQRFLRDSKSNQRTGHLISAVEAIANNFSSIVFIKTLEVNPKQVNASRNYYSHLYLKEGKEDVLSGVDLYKLSQKLKVLLICSILKESEFNIKEIEESISQSGLEDFPY